MRLILLGAPGAGKGTQSRLLVDKYNLTLLSTGEMLRAAVNSMTPLGVRVKRSMESGKLISDEIVNQIISERLDKQDCKSGFILDGYPRTLMQACALTELLAFKKMPLDAIIELKVDEEALIKRVHSRVLEAQKQGAPIRVDDDPSILKRRLIEYREKTAPLSKYYADLGKLYVVDGMADISKVNIGIEKILKEIANF